MGRAVGTGRAAGRASRWKEWSYRGGKRRSRHGDVYLLPQAASGIGMYAIGQVEDREMFEAELLYLSSIGRLYLGILPRTPQSSSQSVSHHETNRSTQVYLTCWPRRIDVLACHTLEGTFLLQRAMMIHISLVECRLALALTSTTTFSFVTIIADIPRDKTRESCQACRAKEKMGDTSIFERSIRFQH